jgi:EAL domain-containing protein (putative c-di-GMP-specific phosphodiesterase class I)/GGDEF domain-containing protein
MFFNGYKVHLLSIYKTNYELNINYLNSKLDKYVLSNDKDNILSEINKGIDTKLFNSIILEYNRFFISKNSLIDSTKDFNDKSWNIAEVVVDSRYGFITSVKNSDLYEFISSNDFDISQPINIRFQVHKKDEIKNIITKFHFFNIKLKNEINSNETTLVDSLVDSLVVINTKDRIHEIKIDSNLIATVVYKIDTVLVRKELQFFLIKLLVFTSILFLPILFLIGFYHKYIFKQYVTMPIEYLNIYLENILNNKFIVLDKSKLEGIKEIKELTKKVTKVSTKIASLKNELNINKESLELKVSTDNLTGLPNKSIFDLDIKTMFISLIKGYIFIVRIDDLSKLTFNYDSGYINNFVESYVNIIKNIIFKYTKTDMKLYRFYGSQFAIVAKNIDIKDAENFCEEVIGELLDRLPDIFDVPEDFVQIGGTAFDLHGSLETVMTSANHAYEESKQKGPNSFHIYGEQDIEKNYSLLDNSVIEVIEKADFKISFVLDSFSFDDPNKLVMTEVSPMLFDHDNKRIAIGSFISVAQKLNLADSFDKLVINKTINYILKNEITHEVAINLSISSIEDKEFIKWLDKTLNENNSVLNKIIFSITSYTAYLHKETFVRFVDDIHNIGAKILLKRYKTDEYPLVLLDDLELDYIRMNKDYTLNFTNDVIKKHKVKNIIIYAELNNIKVITDSVKLDLDYDLLERLGTYATSR